MKNCGGVEEDGGGVVMSSFLFLVGVNNVQVSNVKVDYSLYHSIPSNCQALSLT
jgi:hypothetical protein